MSSITEQLCNQEQSFRLKELGVAQVAAFSWSYNIVRRHWELSYKPASYFQDLVGKLQNLPAMLQPGAVPGHQWYSSAFSVAELGELLRPMAIDGWRTQQTAEGYWKAYWVEGWKYVSRIPPFPHEAQARAALLIHCLEHDLVTIDRVNQSMEAA